MKTGGGDVYKRQGNISSILVNDELVKVSLSLYDTDGLSVSRKRRPFFK